MIPVSVPDSFQGLKVFLIFGKCLKVFLTFRVLSIFLSFHISGGQSETRSDIPPSYGV